MGIHYIRGMQGDKTDGPACIAKHFLGYADSQGGLNCAVSRINDRELYEVRHELVSAQVRLEEDQKRITSLKEEADDYQKKIAMLEARLSQADSRAQSQKEKS